MSTVCCLRRPVHASPSQRFTYSIVRLNMLVLVLENLQLVLVSCVCFSMLVACDL